MPRVQTGPRGPLVLVMSFWIAACTAPSAQPAPAPSSVTPTTSIVTVTTSIPPTSETAVDSTPASAPTAVVPRRPPGLDALELDDVDLAELAILTPSVENVLPHDRTAVTEGLSLLSESQLLESTGFYGRSSRRIINLDDGDLSQSIALPPELYGTGIAVVGVGSDATGLQFTRLEEFVQRFDPEDLSLVSEQRLSEEINGACAVSDTQIAVSTSDGDVQLLSSTTLEVVATITPQLGSVQFPVLTDLSCDDATVWAVLGDTGGIARISVDTGVVVALADLSDLTPAGLAETDVLSGLTYRPSSETWFVTGKRWDVLYEITLG